MRAYKVSGEISEKAYNILGEIMDGFDEPITTEDLKRMAREVCMTVIDEPDSVARNHDGLSGENISE